MEFQNSLKWFLENRFIVISSWSITGKGIVNLYCFTGKKTYLFTFGSSSTPDSVISYQFACQNIWFLFKILSTVKSPCVNFLSKYHFCSLFRVKKIVTLEIAGHYPKNCSFDLIARILSVIKELNMLMKNFIHTAKFIISIYLGKCVDAGI